MARARGWRLRVAAVLVLLLTAAACGSTVEVDRGEDRDRGFVDETDPLPTLPEPDDDPTDPDRRLTADPDPSDPSEPETGRGGPTQRAPADDSASAAGEDTRPSREPADGPRRRQAPGRLKIGVAIGSGNPGHVLGIDASDDPNRLRQWTAAMVEEINATGGFAGREIDVVVREVEQEDSTETAQTRAQNEACVAFAQDSEVFMVLSTVRMYWAQDCYANHQLPMLERHFSNSDDRRMAELDPWILPSFWMTPTRMARLMPIVFDDEGFLTQNMGIIAYEYPDLRRAVENELIPRLEARGGTVRETVFMPVTYDAVLRGISSAVLRFRTNGIDRVIMFAPGGGALAIFAQNAQSQRYQPRYGISTYDQVIVVEPALPPEQMRDLVGVGFLETLDVSVAAQSNPSAREQECWDVMNRRGGFDYRDRSAEANRAGVICELFWLPQAALEPASGRELGPAEIRSYFHALGRTYKPVQVPASSFGQGRYDGIGAYTHMAFDDQREHFIYSKPWARLPALR